MLQLRGNHEVLEVEGFMRAREGNSDLGDERESLNLFRSCVASRPGSGVPCMLYLLDLRYCLPELHHAKSISRTVHLA